MKALELKLPDDLYQKLTDLAAHNHRAVDEFALSKLADIIHAFDAFEKLEQRARRGSFAKFKAAMAKVAQGPPLPGDIIITGRRSQAENHSFLESGEVA